MVARMADLGLVHRHKVGGPEGLEGPRLRVESTLPRDHHTGALRDALQQALEHNVHLDAGSRAQLAQLTHEVLEPRGVPDALMQHARILGRRAIHHRHLEGLLQQPGLQPATAATAATAAAAATAATAAFRRRSSLFCLISTAGGPWPLGPAATPPARDVPEACGGARRR